MKIAKLQIKNFLSIAEVMLNPRKIVLICGANNQGKTSILRSLEVAAQGSSDGSLVKRGETDAEIIVEFDDETSIRRRVKNDGTSTVSVKRGEMKPSKPQTFIDGLFGAGAFNPLELLEPKRRTEVLLSAITLQIAESDLKTVIGDSPVDLPPLDYSQHGLKVAQQAHKYFYQRRTEANKTAKEKDEIARVRRSELPAMPAPSEDLRSDAELEVRKGEIRAEIAAEGKKAEAVDAHQRRSNEAVAKCELIQRQTAENDKEISGLKAKLEILQQRDKQLGEQYAEAHKLVLKLQNENAAIGPDRQKISDLNEETNKIMMELQRRAQAETIKAKHDAVVAAEDVAKEYASFAAKIDGVVESLGPAFRAKLIAKAQLPIEGLSFENDAFTLDGTSIEYLSTSQAMKLAVAVARSVAGPSKLICIDGAESLDEATYSTLIETIRDDGFQYFITKVGEAFEAGADITTIVNMERGEATVSEAANA